MCIIKNFVLKSLYSKNKLFRQCRIKCKWENNANYYYFSFSIKNLKATFVIIKICIKLHCIFFTFFIYFHHRKKRRLYVNEKYKIPSEFIKDDWDSQNAIDKPYFNVTIFIISFQIRLCYRSGFFWQCFEREERKNMIFSYLLS